MSGAPCPLGICDGSGWVEDEEARAVRPCRCRPQLIAGRRQRSLSAVVPRRYRGVSFDRPPVSEMQGPAVPLVERYVRRLDQHLSEGTGLWFVGEVGTGKTTLAMLISEAALKAGRSVAIYSVPRLLAEIRETYDTDIAGSYTSLMDRLTEVDLLHLDDLGAEKASPWVLEQLYSIVNARYEAEKSMLVTANGSTDVAEVKAAVDSLGEQVGERTVSRLQEMCELVPMFGADRRREFRAIDARPTSGLRPA